MGTVQDLGKGFGFMALGFRVVGVSGVSKGP